MENRGLIIESKLADLAFERNINEPIAKDFNFIFAETEQNLSEVMSEFNLDNYIELYDVALNILIETRIRLDEIMPNNNDQVTFLMLISKATTLMIGIRKALTSGLPDVFKCLFRPLTETMDVFYVCLINEEFYNEFGNSKELYDNNEFWYKKARYKSLKPKIRTLMLRISDNEELFNYFNERREAQTKFLSESLHSSFNASFATVFAPKITLELPLDIYGNITTAYPNMLKQVLEEIRIFNFIIHNVCTYPQISPTLNSNELSKSIKLNYLSNKYDDLYTRYIDALDMMGNEIYNGLKQAYEEVKKVENKSPQ